MTRRGRLEGGSRGDAPLAWKTVLLVENDEPLRAIGVRVLELAGADVLACEGADQARELLVEHLPDYVITDIELLDDGGRSLARELHEEPDLHGIFVVALAPPDVARESLQPEFDAVLYKPDNYERVVDALLALQLVDEAPRKRVAARAGDRVFVRDGGRCVGVVQQVLHDGVAVHLEGAGQRFLPDVAVVARRPGKLLLDVSVLESELREVVDAADAR